jgi:hypothetical protein
MTNASPFSKVTPQAAAAPVAPPQAVAAPVAPPPSPQVVAAAVVAPPQPVTQQAAAPVTPQAAPTVAPAIPTPAAAPTVQMPQPAPISDQPQPVVTEQRVKKRGGAGTSIAAGTRKKNSPPKTQEDVLYIIDHYATMSTKEIAVARNLTDQQVNRTVYDTRKHVQDSIKEETDTAIIEKKQLWLDTKFPSKADNFGRKKGSLVDNVLEDLDFSL